MRTFIIAEAGVNHNGDLQLAKKLIDIALEAGVDAVKFQTFKAENLVSQRAPKAEYQKQTTEVAESQFKMLKKLELSFDDFVEMKSYCDQKKLLFLSSPFDLESIDWLAKMKMPIYKVPSGEITNLPYLLKIAAVGKPVIMSTGMSRLDEIETAVNVLQAHGCREVTLLHCTTEYPAPYAEVNLKALGTLKEKFNLPVGYSDHTKGIEIPVAAVAMGAAVIEKHFTLDRGLPGPDHQASLEPLELKAMVAAIRNVELALGSGEKKLTESEKKNVAVARKSIVAKTRIKKGEEFSEENLAVKRPGDGISPMRWFDVLGRKASRDFEEDELIEL
jgi:N,N'-diacetyllegionaminate synthase